MPSIKYILDNCDKDRCVHEASYAVLRSTLVIEGRYCYQHGMNRLEELKEEEKENAEPGSPRAA